MFCRLEASTVGIEQLSLKLTRQLVDHIQDCLPNLLKDVEKALKDTTEGLDRLGEPIPENKISYLVTVRQTTVFCKNNKMLITQVLLNYGKTLIAVAKGECMFQEETNSYRHLFNAVRSCFVEFSRSVRKLCPGALTSYLHIFCTYYVYFLKQGDEDLETIKTLIKEQRGRELPGYIFQWVCFPFSVDKETIRQFIRFENYGVFEGLAQKTVRKFERPALECLAAVRQLVEKVWSIYEFVRDRHFVVTAYPAYSCTSTWRLISLKDLPL